ncbi:MAG TPA: hypothetical protein VIM79_21285, partial [Niastella sp.]
SLCRVFYTGHRLSDLKIPGIHRVNDVTENTEFHHLAIAMTVIMGIAAAIGIPVLVHSKKFEEEVL